MTQTLERIVHMSCGHQMTEESLAKTIQLMRDKLAAAGMHTTGCMNFPDSDILLRVTNYDAEKFRHTLHTFRYKIVKNDGLFILLNLY